MKLKNSTDKQAQQVLFTAEYYCNSIREMCRKAIREKKQPEIKSFSIKKVLKHEL